MHAVIYPRIDCPGAAMLPIAGRPLVVRQLQWLSAAGCESIAVALGPGMESAGIRRTLKEQGAIGAEVVLVEAAELLDLAAIGRCAGFPAGAPILGVPGDVLGGGDLRALLDRPWAGSARLGAAVPPGLEGALERGELEVTTAVEGPREALSFAGWTARIDRFASALSLGIAVLDGRLSRGKGASCWGVQLHASERSPGVWIGRGALVEPGAELMAPVLIGAGAVVRAGARVGPGAFIGDRAVIEAEAEVTRSIVLADTIVGVGLSLETMVAGPRGLRHLGLELHVEIDDPLLLAPRGNVSALRLFPGSLGLFLLLLLLLPFESLLQLVTTSRLLNALPRFLGVALGTRALLAPSPETEPAPSTPAVEPHAEAREEWLAPTQGP